MVLIILITMKIISIMIHFPPTVSPTNLQQTLPHLVSRPHGHFEDTSTTSWVVLKGTVNVIPYFKKN